MREEFYQCGLDDSESVGIGGILAKVPAEDNQQAKRELAVGQNI